MSPSSSLQLSRTARYCSDENFYRVHLCNGRDKPKLTKKALVPGFSHVHLCNTNGFDWLFFVIPDSLQSPVSIGFLGIYLAIIFIVIRILCEPFLIRQALSFLVFYVSCQFMFLPKGFSGFLTIWFGTKLLQFISGDEKSTAAGTRYRVHYSPSFRNMCR